MPVWCYAVFKKLLVAGSSGLRGGLTRGMGTGIGTKPGSLLPTGLSFGAGTKGNCRSARRNSKPK